MNTINVETRPYGSYADHLQVGYYDEEGNWKMIGFPNKLQDLKVKSVWSGKGAGTRINQSIEVPEGYGYSIVLMNRQSKVQQGGIVEVLYSPPEETTKETPEEKPEEKPEETIEETMWKYASGKIKLAWVEEDEEATEEAIKETIEPAFSDPSEIQELVSHFNSIKLAGEYYSSKDLMGMLKIGRGRVSDLAKSYRWKSPHRGLYAKGDVDKYLKARHRRNVLGDNQRDALIWEDWADDICPECGQLAIFDGEKSLICIGEHKMDVSNDTKVFSIDGSNGSYIEVDGPFGIGHADTVSGDYYVPWRADINSCKDAYRYLDGVEGEYVSDPIVFNGDIDEYVGA